MVTVISATAAKQRFAALLDAAQRGPVRIQRHERDVAVLVSPGDYELLRQIRAQELTQLADKMSRYAASQGMTDEELQKRMAVGGEASSDGAGLCWKRRIREGRSCARQFYSRTSTTTTNRRKPRSGSQAKSRAFRGIQSPGGKRRPTSPFEWPNRRASR